jgi:hypothetical protein
MFPKRADLNHQPLGYEGDALQVLEKYSEMLGYNES